MDYVTRVPVDVAGSACATMMTMVEQSMSPSVEYEEDQGHIMMSHEPLYHQQQHDMMENPDDVMPSVSADSTMLYDTAPYAMYTPLISDGAPLVLASFMPHPAGSAVDEGDNVDMTMATTVPGMMDSPMPSSSFEQDQEEEAPQASASYMNNGPGPTMVMDNSMTEQPLAMDNGENHVGLSADLIQHGEMPMASVMPMAMASPEYDGDALSMTAAATQEAYTDAMTVSSGVMSSHTTMYSMSAEPSLSMWHEEEEEEESPQASTMAWHMEPTVTPMASYYYSYSFSASPPPQDLTEPTLSQMATPVPNNDSDYDYDVMMTPAPSSSSGPVVIGLPYLKPTSTLTTSVTTIPTMTAVTTASATVTVTVSATVTVTVAKPDMSATTSVTTSATTTVTSSTTTTVTTTVKMTLVPTTKVTTIPGRGGNGNGLGVPGAFPEMSAVPTPEMDMSKPQTTMEAEAKQEEKAKVTDEVGEIDLQSNVYDGEVIKSPEVEVTNANEMTMTEEYVTATTAAEMDSPKQDAEEAAEQVVPTPNTYSSVKDGDTTTTTTIPSDNNKNNNHMDEDDMGTVSLTEPSPTSTTNTATTNDSPVSSSAATMPTASPDLVDDLLDDADDMQQPQRSSDPATGSGPVGGDTATDDTPATPEPDEEVCIDARLLTHLPANDLVYGENHRRAAVLCDDTGSCATAGHMVYFRGKAMSMQTYCATHSAQARCVRRVTLVNSPRYRLRGMKVVASKTNELEFSAHAARFATGMEEWVLRMVMSMGL